MLAEGAVHIGARAGGFRYTVHSQRTRDCEPIPEPAGGAGAPTAPSLGPRGWTARSRGWRRRPAKPGGFRFPAPVRLAHPVQRRAPWAWASVDPRSRVVVDLELSPWPPQPQSAEAR